MVTVGGMGYEVVSGVLGHVLFFDMSSGSASIFAL